MAWTPVSSFANGFVLGPGITFQVETTAPPAGTPNTVLTAVRPAT